MLCLACKAVGPKVPAHDTHKNESGRILLFPARLPFTKARRRAGVANPESVADLRRFEQDSEPDDFSHRMKINVIAFAFIVMLTITGVWLADQLALLHKHSDCAFIGHKSCASTETPP